MTEDRNTMVSADLADGDQTMVVSWGDGHESRLPLRHLRHECPCASCRIERQEARTNPFRVIGPDAKPPSSKMVGLEAVGRYGLKIGWGDGHDAGIYTFEYLREICPCDECKSQRTGENLPYVHGIYIPR